MRSYAVSELDLARLQLDPPYATAILNETAIEFGNLEPLQGLRYIRVADQVHLIPDSYLQLIEAGYTQFVRRRLFGEGRRINQIKLPDFSITRTNKGWAVDPAQAVSADEIQQFIDRWQEAAGLNILAADPVQDGDLIEISFVDEAQNVSLVITESEQELILVRPDLGILYRMGDRAGSLLEIKPPASEEQN